MLFSFNVNQLYFIHIYFETIFEVRDILLINTFE